MRSLFCFLALALTLASQSFAQPSPEAMTNEVTDTVATEYAECSAYFGIVQGAFASSGKSQQSAKFKELSDKAAEFSLMATERSRSTDMATRVTLAQIAMSMKEMQKTIDNNYSNISLLMEKHSDSCVEPMTDSSALI
jgi:hypothetical protein